MARKFFGLLVGIDTYAANVSNLRGCVNDVNHINDYLKENVPLNQCIETLKNSDAARQNIIRLFRDHLCKARENDVVFFHYSGHGSRELSASVFKEYSSDDKEETLVCYDSRINRGYDLADKELAVLLWEVAKNNPHIVVSLDCCHSGSGTREVDDFNLAGVRQTPGRSAGAPRPLESYLDGFYENMDTISIPRSRHVLMAACDRTQKAWETKDHRGVFSTTLVEVLTKSGPALSYADLFVRCRAAILKRARKQTPQFETYSHFMPYTKFLDGGPLEQKARYHVYFDKGNWKMSCGALHGLPTDVEKRVEVALYPESSVNRPTGKIVGYAEAVSVGAHSSIVMLDFDSSASARYAAEIVSLPVPPMPVLWVGDEESKALVNNWQDQTANFAFTDEPAAAKYALTVREGRFLLRHIASDLLIQGAEGDPKKCFDYICSVLKQVVRWERGMVLQNHNTRFNPEQVDFKFFEVLDDGTECEYPGDSVTLDLVNTPGGWKKIRAKLRVRSRIAQTLHVTLAYFSRKFGIYILNNEPLEPGKDFVTLWGEGENDHIKLPDGTDEAVDTFKLVVSTEKVDDFLLIQKELELGKILSYQDLRDIGTVEEYIRRRRQKVTNDWFTKTLTVKTVRQLNLLGDQS